MKSRTFNLGITFRLLSAVALAVGMASLTGGKAQAVVCVDPYTVTTNADSGAGSLRDGVVSPTGVCNNGTILFNPSLSGQTITLTSGQISIDKNITIDSSSLKNQVTVSGNNLSRIFYINGVSLTLDSLKLVNGKADNGGAILNDGTLHVYGSTFSNNTATAQVILFQQNFDGVTAPALPSGWTSSSWTTTNSVSFSSPNSVYSPAPISPGAYDLVSPSFTLTNAFPLTFQNEYKFEVWLGSPADGAVLDISVDGGAFQDILDAGGSFAAGGYNGTINSASNPLDGRAAWTGLSGPYAFPTFVETSVNLPASAVGHLVQLRWRVATDSGGPTVGYGQWIDDVMVGTQQSKGGAIGGTGGSEILNSTFTGNTADFGGAIYNFTLGSTIINSTFSANTANTSGGAVFNEPISDGSEDISFSTFAGNHAGVSGGALDAPDSGNGLILDDTILSNNTPSNCWTGNNAKTEDHNIFSDASCHFWNSGADGTHDKNSTNPLLGSLSNNGGPTQTFALLSGSPAIDNGTIGASCPEIDQRGVTRPVGTSCDIGAFEYDPIPQVYVSSSSPADGSHVASGISSLKVVFNKAMLHDGSANAANNANNYLLVEAGLNRAFDTLSCLGGRIADDVPIDVNPVSYDTGTFTATLTVNGGVALPAGNYRLFVCGTTSVIDLYGLKLNYGLSDTTITFIIGGSTTIPTTSVPATGFAPGKMTSLPVQPAVKFYNSLGDLWLEIPKLGVQMSIVGVPQTNGSWDVSWLGNNAGWLNGSAFPTWKGNSVLTGHVWNADNTPGPFRSLNTLWWGDKVIVHAWGGQYTYEVRAVMQVSPGDTAAMMKHQDMPWLTLVTCRGYNETTGSYKYRVLVRAVLVDVK